MSNELPADAKVRFTHERLSVLTPRDRQGLVGRIGVIQTDSKFIGKPTVYFPATAEQPELRLFRVDPRQLELVESPPEPVITPSPNDVADHSSLATGSGDVEPTSTGEGEKLSQNDLDSFFD